MEKLKAWPWLASAWQNSMHLEAREEFTSSTAVILFLLLNYEFSKAEEEHAVSDRASTGSIIPDGEKVRSERAKEAMEKDRLKSTGAKRTLIIARVDEVPECFENLEIIMNRLKLKQVKKEFALVCDVKLIDILVGLQGCSSMYPCPYCMGCKVDDLGNPTNQRGTFKKGAKRTFGNVKDQYKRSTTKYRNGKLPSRKSLKKFFCVKNLPSYGRHGKHPHLHT